MIVVTEIKAIKVPDDFREYVLRTRTDTIPVECNGFHDDMSTHEVVELVRGRRYINPRDNTDVIIGYGTEAEKIIGITYDCFERSQQLKEDAETKLFNKEKELQMIRSIKKDNDFNFYLIHGHFPQ